MRKPKCPHCRTNDKVIEILYGMPTHDAYQDSLKGLLKIGGCIVDEKNPDWYCKRCKKEF
jgi:hypothetical protein